MTSLGIAIISWPEFEENAALILSEVHQHADTVLVLHNAESHGASPNAEHWVNFDSDAYFGQKFSWSIKNFGTDVLLFIVADTWHDNWGELVEQCREAFSSNPEVAIWAPIVEETWWNTEKILVSRDLVSTSLEDVVAVDSIVWALSSHVVKSMRKLDYSTVKFGWGIEVVAAGIARCSGKLVVRDIRHEVRHRRGTTYPTEAANEQAQTFYQQLTPPIRSMVTVIEEFALLRTVVTPKNLVWALRRGWGYLRDNIYRLTVKKFVRRGD